MTKMTFGDRFRIGMVTILFAWMMIKTNASIEDIAAFVVLNFFIPMFVYWIFRGRGRNLINVPVICLGLSCMLALKFKDNAELTAWIVKFFT